MGKVTKEPKDRDVIITIEGITPYSASKHFEEDLQNDETKDAHERRRWREKAHADDDGNVYVPGVAFKACFDEAAKRSGKKVEGRRGATYTALFQGGVTAMTALYLGLKVEDLKAIEIFANADGRRGSGTRVTRFFPLVRKWRGQVTMRLFNKDIPKDVFEEIVTYAGKNCGVGRGRPSTGCPAGNGRFRPLSFEWSEV